MSKKETIKTESQNAPLIVTGYSGAGMSSVLKALEDLGFEVFDNFPLTLVPALLSDGIQQKPIAIGIDTRTRGFDAHAVIQTSEQFSGQIIFISCDENELQKRFTETRRRHPQAGNQRAKVGIQKEHKMLSALKAHADLIIDTTRLSIHDLKSRLKGAFGAQDTASLTLTLMSFGFKHSAPRSADIVMDVRFLRNPHWVEDLKPLTGRDKPVGDYIAQDIGYKPFLKHFKALLSSLLPRYADEGKSYLTVAIGCTGGHHRSVFTVETLSAWLEGEGYTPHIEHRDIEK